MKNIYGVVLLILLLIIMSSCPDEKNAFFRVENNSEKSVVVCVAYIYPDTLLPDKDKVFAFRTLKAGEKRSLAGVEFDDIGLDRMKNEKLTLFFIDKSVYEAEAWETIQKEYLILKRLEVTWDDYIKTKGAFAYP